MNSRAIIQTVVPADIASDDQLRSDFIRRLILHNPGRRVSKGLPPRLLIQFWNDATHVPADVRTCLDSWAPLEQSGFKRLLFDDATAFQFIDDNFSERHVLAFDACDHPAMRADYFRLCFMLQVGGFYVDADDRYLGQPLDKVLGDSRLRLQALCYDIPTGSMLAPYEAAKGGERTSHIFYVNNDPLIAPARHPLVVHTLERATDQVLSAGASGRDIQAMTGPGNLTACLIEHALELQGQGSELDFALLPNWDAIAVSTWPLEYRSDDRNWRNWVRGNG
jgi:hypothetical protein